MPHKPLPGLPTLSRHFLLEAQDRAATRIPSASPDGGSNSRTDRQGPLLLAPHTPSAEPSAGETRIPAAQVSVSGSQKGFHFPNFPDFPSVVKVSKGCMLNQRPNTPTPRPFRGHPWPLWPPTACTPGPRPWPSCCPRAPQLRGQGLPALPLFTGKEAGRGCESPGLGDGRHLPMDSLSGGAFLPTAHWLPKACPPSVAWETGVGSSQRTRAWPQRLKCWPGAS